MKSSESITYWHPQDKKSTVFCGSNVCKDVNVRIHSLCILWKIVRSLDFFLCTVVDNSVGYVDKL
jgi:hypothetical protein